MPIGNESWNTMVVIAHNENVCLCLCIIKIILFTLDVLNCHYENLRREFRFEQKDEAT